MHVHSGLPVIQNGVLSQVSFDEYLWADSEIKNCIGNQCNAVDVSNPRGFDPAYDRARHERVDVTIGQDDETRTQRRDDPVLELVREIGGVKQAERSRAKNVALHRPLQLAAHEHGSLQSDIDCRITAPFQPITEKIDLGRATGPIGSFNNNELSFQLIENNSRDSLSVKSLWFFHEYY